MSSIAARPSRTAVLGAVLALLLGLMFGIESIVHYTMNSMEDPNIKAFGIPFNDASPVTWAASVILIVGGLTFFPALALGPIVEHLAMLDGTLF